MARRPFFGQGPGPLIARMDMNAATAVGREYGKAFREIGQAAGIAANSFIERQNQKKQVESSTRGFMAMGFPADVAKAMAKDKGYQDAVMKKKQLDQQMAIAKMQDATSRNNAEAPLIQKQEHWEAQQLEKQKNELADNQFISKIMGPSSVPTGQLNEAGQDELERGSLFIAPTEEARSDFRDALLKDPSTQTKVPMMDLSDNQFIQQFSEDSPEVQRRAFNLMQANAPKPMTPLQLQEYKIKEAEENRRQTEFNERNQNPSENLSVGQETIDREFAKDIVEFNSADVEKGLTQLQEASARLGGTAKDADGKAIEPENLTGVMIGLMPDSFNDIFNPKASEVREAVEEVVQRNLRLVLGAQFTEKEGQRLISRAYNPRLDEKENKKRVDRLIKSIEGAMQQKQDQARYFNEKGTLKGYQFAPVSIESIERDAFDGSTPQQPTPQSRDELLKQEADLQRRLNQRLLNNPPVQQFRGI